MPSGNKPLPEPMLTLTNKASLKPTWIKYVILINKLWPSDAIWHQRTKSSLVYVMAHRLFSVQHQAIVFHQIHHDNHPQCALNNHIIFHKPGQLCSTVHVYSGAIITR